MPDKYSRATVYVFYTYIAVTCTCDENLCNGSEVSVASLVAVLGAPLLKYILWTGGNY